MNTLEERKPILLKPKDKQLKDLIHIYIHKIEAKIYYLKNSFSKCNMRERESSTDIVASAIIDFAGITEADDKPGLRLRALNLHLPFCH